LDWRKPREAEQLLVSEKKVADNDVSLVTRLLGSYAYGNHSGYTSNEKAKIDAVYFAGPFV
jgi:NitT/TauT family transport system substrate-binding protein